MKDYISESFYLYPLKLSNNKWFIYVTREQNIKAVYELSKYRYEYIYNNSPILSHECTKINDILEIDYFVKKYMRLYGIDKVRGGSYTSEILSIEEQNILLKEINQKFNNLDKPVDTTISEYNNISDWSLETIENRKKELLKKIETYYFDQEKYNMFMKKLYNTERIIERKILLDIEWLDQIIDQLINEYYKVNNDNIMNDEIYEVPEIVINTYKNVRKIIIGLNKKFIEIYENEEYVYCSNEILEQMIQNLDNLFTITDYTININEIIINKEYVFRQLNYMYYCLINKKDEYEFDKNDYPENFEMMTKWKLNKLEEYQEIISKNSIIV